MDIREVSAPRVIVGVDPTLRPGEVRSAQQPGGAVVIKFAPGGAKGPPVVKVIPTESFEQADELVEEIQRARKALKSAQPAEARVVVGECEECHKPLRAKAHAIRKEMHLTCKCGHANRITVSDVLLK